MEKGDRLQYACGHWLVAGEFGIQDASVKDVPTKRCGECQRRLQDAAPALLEALENIMPLAQTGFSAMARSEQGAEIQAILRAARRAIEAAK
ncbi:hypothetical protein LCGC14_1811040 [marine sediment metagenome]|uniref:Uncharacterized protein n=1 Tax=marine sediment metagenome TaxID=412755 RepID=A0A0F9GLY9_9ZZZZ